MYIESKTPMQSMNQAQNAIKIHPCLLLLQSDLFADIEADLDQVACNKLRKKMLINSFQNLPIFMLVQLLWYMYFSLCW